MNYKFLRPFFPEFFDRLRDRTKIALMNKRKPQKSEFDFDVIRKRISIRADISREE